MDISMIKDAAYVILFAISVYGFWHGRDKDKSDRTEQFVKINWKLDDLCRSQTSIKDELRDLTKKANSTDTRLALLEQRIEAIEQKEG